MVKALNSLTIAIIFAGVAILAALIAAPGAIGIFHIACAIAAAVALGALANAAAAMVQATRSSAR